MPLLQRPVRGVLPQNGMAGSSTRAGGRRPGGESAREWGLVSGGGGAAGDGTAVDDNAVDDNAVDDNAVDGNAVAVGNAAVASNRTLLGGRSR